MRPVQIVFTRGSVTSSIRPHQSVNFLSSRSPSGRTDDQSGHSTRPVRAGNPSRSRPRGGDSCEGDGRAFPLRRVAALRAPREDRSRPVRASGAALARQVRRRALAAAHRGCACHIGARGASPWAQSRGSRRAEEIGAAKLGAPDGPTRQAKSALQQSATKSARVAYSNGPTPSRVIPSSTSLAAIAISTSGRISERRRTKIMIPLRHRLRQVDAGGEVRSWVKDARDPATTAVRTTVPVGGGCRCVALSRPLMQAARPLSRAGEDRGRPAGPARPQGEGVAGRARSRGNRPRTYNCRSAIVR
jgi:hypothetical protein